MVKSKRFGSSDALAALSRLLGPGNTAGAHPRLRVSFADTSGGALAEVREFEVPDLKNSGSMSGEGDFFADLFTAFGEADATELLPLEMFGKGLRSLTGAVLSLSVAEATREDEIDESDLMLLVPGCSLMS